MIFHQFSYQDDSEKSVKSIRSIRNLYPDAPIYLWSDGNKPVNPELDYGENVQVRQTYFNRLQNLNGAKCVLGMRECYATGYAENPEETCHIKLDPDSLLFHTDKMDELIAANAYYFCPGTSNSLIYGWFQFHSRAFHEDYQGVRDIRQFTAQPSFGEDLVFNEAATKLAMGRNVFHSDNSSNKCRAHFDRECSVEEALSNSATLVYVSRTFPDDGRSVADIMEDLWAAFLESQP